MDRPIGRLIDIELSRRPSRVLLGFGAAPHRALPQVLATLEQLVQLALDITPFPHPRIAEEMRFAPPTHLRLRQSFKLVVQRFPNREQREEIRLLMSEPTMSRIGRRLLIERSLPRILHAESRRDDHHLAQRLLFARLQNHSPHCRVHRQSA